MYTQINPSALRLSISKKCSLRISINCLLCRPCPDLVRWCSAVDNVNNFLKCSGPLPSAALCNTPNIAISRLHDKGARLKCTSASSREIPSSLKNLVWNLSSGANILSHAWYIAAVLYSKYESSWLLYKFTNSASLTSGHFAVLPPFSNQLRIRVPRPRLA